MRLERIGLPGIAMAAMSAMAFVLANGTVAAGAKKPVTIALFVAIQANPVEQAIINAFKRVADDDGGRSRRTGRQPIHPWPPPERVRTARQRTALRAAPP